MEKTSEKRRRVGINGENAACEYLLSKGYTITERNFRITGGEIDIVARDGAYTVFTEVKSRSPGPSKRFGRASDAVNYKKRLRFVTAVKAYQKMHPEAMKCRIDVIEVYFRREIDVSRAEIRHIKSAFGDIKRS